MIPMILGGYHEKKNTTKEALQKVNGLQPWDFIFCKTCKLSKHYAPNYKCTSSFLPTYPFFLMYYFPFFFSSFLSFLLIVLCLSSMITSITYQLKCTRTMEVVEWNVLELCCERAQETKVKLFFFLFFLFLTQ